MEIINVINDESIVDSKTGILINPSRDNRMTDFAKKLIKDYYLKDNETIQEGFARASFAWCGNKPQLAQRIYDAVSQGWFMFASPVLSNAPEVLDRETFTFKKEKGLPISCFLSTVEDSLKGLVENSTETRWLSVKGGGVGINFSEVRSADKMTPGAIPFICTYDTDMEAYKQGRIRRGSIAIYMDIEHPDVIEFLNLRIPTGDESRKCHSTGFHNALNISDNFMKAVIEDLDWNLIDPHSKEIKKTMKARDLWDRILEVRYRTGEPYLHFIDTSNRNLPYRQKELGLRINNSNLCVAPETNILTKTGTFPIHVLENKNVEVWNGEEWSETTVVKTGTNQKLITLKFSNGSYIDCTEYHKFYINDGKEVRANELKVGDKIAEYTLPIDIGYKLVKDITVVSIEDNGRLDDTYCFNEPKNHKGVFNGILTGNCNEIMLPTNNERTAVCCLSSLNVEKYDDWKDTTLVQDLIEMLDNVLDYFITNAPDEISKARYSAMRERSLGLGVMGFHYLLQKNMIPFESQDARNINKKVFKHINEEAIIATKKLAIEKGECPDFIVDLTFTFDNNSQYIVSSSNFVDVKQENEVIQKRAFEILPDDIIVVNSVSYTVAMVEGKHPNSGWRNANLTALAPNGNSGILCMTSPSIEPSNSNAYVQQTRGGTLTNQNPYLVELLEKKGLNNEEVWSRIINSGGTIQDMDDIFTIEEMSVFKTAFELNQNWIIRHAADRQPYLTQGQSVNLFVGAGYDKESFSNIHILAWKQGLKGLYYTRTKSSARPDQIAKKIERVALKDSDENDNGECVACQG